MSCFRAIYVWFPSFPATASSSSENILKQLQFKAPTPIQAQAIPAIMSGRDVIGVARTGSGKTMAFLLPMFRHIKDQRPLANGEGPIGVVLTPTRELALQIFAECKRFGKAMGWRVCREGDGVCFVTTSLPIFLYSTTPPPFRTHDRWSVRTEVHQ